MASPSLWSNVAVAVQSALGPDKTITAITKANPAVVSSTGHGYSNGDYVVLNNILGMSQVNGRVFRVASVTSDTFALESEDTTLYDTFTSGVANKITYGITMTSAVGLNAAGGDFSFVKTTTIHDNVETQIPGIASAASYTLDNIWDVSDAALVALKVASDNKAKRAMRFTFANAQKILFSGYVGATLLPTGSAQDLVKTPVVLTMHGRPTTYAT